MSSLFAELGQKAPQGGQSPSAATIAQSLRKSSSTQAISHEQSPAMFAAQFPEEEQKLGSTEVHHPKSNNAAQDTPFTDDLPQPVTYLDNSEKSDGKPSNNSPGDHSPALPLAKPWSKSSSDNSEIMAAVAAAQDGRTKIRVAVCCVEKKLSSRPMREILKFLARNQEIEILRFNDEMLKKKPIEEWIRCDVLIAFYSTGFPLAKAIEYVKRYKPVMINDLQVQHELWDRVKVLDKLRKIEVPVAKSYVVYRGPKHGDFTQEEIETQALGTKDRGEFYLREAATIRQEKAPLHRRQNSLNNNNSDNLSQKGFVGGADNTRKESLFSSTNDVNQPLKKKTNSTDSSPTQVQSESPEQTKQATAAATTETQQSLNQQLNSALGSSQVSNGASGGPKSQTSDTNMTPVKQKRQIKSDVLFEDSDADVEEYDDCIVIRGNVLKKPFIEKPVNAEDHEIMIHYSNSSPCGSGYSVLFRKTESACSQFIPTQHQSTIRTEGSYLYEEFLPTDGFDIKVYTVGEDYAHAEARRCPSIDGKVQRDEATGKEIRYPVNLNHEEKEMARRICREFKQDICGFDMLRCGGKTYVCDVNGFSFVKTSFKYYEDCAMQLRRIIYRKLNIQEHKLEYLLSSHDTSSQRSGNGMRPFRPSRTTDGKNAKSNANGSPATESGRQSDQKRNWELRSVVAVFRHGDRTPKQKMKMKVRDPEYLKFFSKGIKDVKLKKPKEMQEILKITNDKITAICQRKDSQNLESEQLELEKLVQLKYVLQRDKFEGLNRKIQMKCLQCKEVPGKVDQSGKPVMQVTEALFILKFGGELTHAGCNQADNFGAVFRQTMYVDDNDEPSAKGGGLLRLHSTYRHDLKVYTSDEGRCQKTAASFLKGLLQIEGALAPILAIMVINDKATKKMLDDSTPAQEALDHIKIKLNKLLHYQGEDLVDEFIRQFNESPPRVIEEILNHLGNPMQTLDRLHEMVTSVIHEIEERLGEESAELSYRMLPKQYTKTFATHTKSKFQKNMSFRSSVQEMSQLHGPDFLNRRRPRSHSPDGNMDKRESRESVIQNKNKEETDRKKAPIDEFILGADAAALESNDSQAASSTDPKLAFYEAKQVFLRELEKANNRRKSPKNSRHVTGLKPENVIREMIAEEDNVSLHSAKREHDAHVGISVNERLAGDVVDCDGQPYLVQLKRWKKIENDMIKKDGTYDISKIPEVCDNIKFDLLHSPEMINDERLQLLELSQLLCRVIVPMEYGVTSKEQIDVGLKIINPLLTKIEHDILWWKNESHQMPSAKTREYGEDRQWEKSGLDEAGLDDRVRSSWRHIRSRLYFTSASHMYTLLNTLKLGVDSILLSKDDVETKKQLDDILRLDFMSSFVFRLFEDLSVHEGDENRFKLEIMVNRGATVDREIIQRAKQQNHTVPIMHENFVDINKSLTFQQLETFFKHLLTMQESSLHHPINADDLDEPGAAEREAKKAKKEKKKKQGKVQCESGAEDSQVGSGGAETVDIGEETKGNE